MFKLSKIYIHISMVGSLSLSFCNKKENIVYDVKRNLYEVLESPEVDSRDLTIAELKARLGNQTIDLVPCEKILYQPEDTTGMNYLFLSFTGEDLSERIDKNSAYKIMYSIKSLIDSTIEYRYYIPIDKEAYILFIIQDQKKSKIYYNAGLFYSIGTNDLIDCE